MNKSILLSILMLISASAFAATVQVNGNSCGSWSKMTTSPNGDIAITADGTCGAAAPVEPPPVVVPPSACPAGVTCLDRPFPLVQEVITLRAGQVISIKLPADVTGKQRRVTSQITTGNTAARRMAISDKPGDVNPAQSRCSTQGFEAVSLRYTAGEPTSTTACFVPAGQSVYWNITPTNCPDGQKCSVYISGN